MAYYDEPDDPGPPPRTLPEKPVPGERFIEAERRDRWAVCDWYHEPCVCVGRVRGEHGEPYPDPACPECKGTGDGVLVPELIAEDLAEEDARMLAFGSGLLDVLERVQAASRRHTDGTARMDAAILDEIRTAVAGVKGKP
jgi:hypothetical protein